MNVRGIHDKNNPFVQINTKAIRDPALSLKSKGLFAHIMSHDNLYHINVTDLCYKLKEKKTAIYSALKELINHGYCNRFQRKCYNPRTKTWTYDRVLYVVYEINTDEFKIKAHEEYPELREYKLDGLNFKSSKNQDLGAQDLERQDPEIENKEAANSKAKVDNPPPKTRPKSSRKTQGLKKCLPHSGFLHAQNLKALSNIKYLSNDKYKEKEKLKESASSQDAILLCSFFLSIIKKNNPNFKEPNRIRWCKTIDKMLQQDNRNIEEVKKVLLWAFARRDNYWPTAMLNPRSLRIHYDRACMTMNNLQELSISKFECIDENKKYAKKIDECWQKVPAKIKYNHNFYMSDKYVEFSSTPGGCEQIHYSQPKESFKNQCESILRKWRLMK